MSEQVETTATEVKNEASAPATPDLTINDLQALKTIVDVSCQRGTFKANEMASVGQVFNRLTAFLDHITSQKEAETQKQ
jgi:hypothetical protein